ncbi:MAG: 6-phosphofructokinase, partial [Synergistales bacterium]|nr:6-phosphofructokinase [Synergistales bacterium]
MAQLRNCVVAQSGGPTAVINSSLCGVVDEAREHSCVGKVFGAFNGIEGVISGRFIDLSSMDGEWLKRIRHTPGAILGGCRHMIREGDQGEKEIESILEVFVRHQVRYFFYIGGNDSMDTAL